MRVAIMQPYFLPYIGYFQLINTVDVFVLYDNIKYTKKGWINRNRMLRNGRDVMFSVPLKSGSDSLQIVERCIAEDFDRSRLMGQFRGAYQRAPYFKENAPWLEKILQYPDSNLFHFLRHSIQETCSMLAIETPIIVSSTVDIDHSLAGQDKVLAVCEALGATTYVNSIGGVGLYSDSAFASQGMDLRFLKSLPVEYKQHGGEFIPWLSIVDVLMFNPIACVRDDLATKIELIKN